jgi:hypothetical protein
MEDKIQALCQKLIEGDEKSEDFQSIGAELRSTLSQRFTQIRHKLKAYPLAKERRNGTTE